MQALHLCNNDFNTFINEMILFKAGKIMLRNWNKERFSRAFNTVEDDQDQELEQQETKYLEAIEYEEADGKGSAVLV